MRRNLFGLTLSLLIAACATSPEVSWQARHAAAEAMREAVRFSEQPLADAWTPVEVTTTLVPINDPSLEAGTGQLVYAGGIQITSDFNRLHGLSDIKFEDAERFFSISDEGLLVRGRIQLDDSGRLIGVDGVEVRPLTDPDGQALVPKYLADAEGLALMPNGELLVSFERLHRVWRYSRDGRWLGERAMPDYRFTENEGPEAIAAGQDNALWMAGEDGGMWLCRPQACETVQTPPGIRPGEDDLRVTSMDADPTSNGRFVLQRAYHAAPSTNTIRLNLWDDLTRPRPRPDRELATFSAPATVDNFEGIAAVRRPDGGTRIYILSDDNFSDRQRTLLMAFDVR